MRTVHAAQDYNRWLRSRTFSSLGYSFLAGIQGSMVVNTPIFQLHRELQLRPEQRVLDVACGRGSLLRVLSSRVRFQMPPVGIDASKEMLRLALADQRDQPGAPVAFALASAIELPFPDDLFDIATCSYLIKHLDDAGLARFLRELLRVLKPGGLAVIWEFAPTSSARLNAWHRWLLTLGVRECNLRPFSDLVSAANAAGFDWVSNARLRPFLFPPIPRVSLILGKAPEGWRERTGPGRARRAAVEAARSQGNGQDAT